MTYCSSSLISDHDHHQLYFDSDDDAGDESFDGMLQHIRDQLVTSDEDKAMELLTQKVVEEFVWFKTRERINCLKDKNEVGYTDPLDLFIPKKKRGSRDHVVSKKKRDKKKSCSYSSINSCTIIKDEIKAKRKQNRRRRIDIDGDDDEGKEGIKRSTKKKKVEKVDLKKLGWDQLDFSDEIKSLISWQEGTDKDFTLRITKKLFQTDMNDHHDRLSMPMNQIKDFQGLLNDEEKKELSKPKLETNGIEVKLFDLSSIRGHDDEQNVNDIRVETMRLRKWDMKNSSCFMLTTSWKTVLDKNDLKVNEVVQIYSFRRNGNLFFVLIKVSDGEGCRDGAFGSSSSNNYQGNGASGSSQGKNEDVASPYMSSCIEGIRC